MEKEFERFVISQGALLFRDEKCLILEFSKWPGMWGLPGGRIDKKEGAMESLSREIKEEIGLSEFEVIGMADYDIDYTAPEKEKCNIIVLIKNDKDEIVLSNEHLQMKWIAENEIRNFAFRWPNMDRILKNGFKYYRLLK